MNAPVNTLGYMVAGYIVIFAVLLIYLVSLFIRWRNLRQDEETFGELEKKESPTGVGGWVTRDSSAEKRS